MSHMLTCEFKIENEDMLKEAINDLNANENFGCEILGHGTNRIYSRDVTGFHIKPRGWSYPICITDTGEIKYDNYNGNWGNIEDLNKIGQAYLKTMVLRHGRQEGWQSTVREEENGDLIITMVR